MLLSLCHHLQHGILLFQLFRLISHRNLKFRFILEYLNHIIHQLLHNLRMKGFFNIADDTILICLFLMLRCLFTGDHNKRNSI